MSEERTIVHDERVSNISSVVLAALVGGLVGAAVGVMVAPKTGKELRGDIVQKTMDKWDETNIVEQGKEMVHELANLVNSLRSNKSNTVELKPTEEPSPAVEFDSSEIDE